MTARSDGIKEPHEFWAAIGNQLRPSLTVTATIAMDVAPAVSARMAVAASTRIGLLDARGAPGAEPVLVRIAGRVVGADGAPVADASVELVELGRATRTDAGGLWQVGGVASGTYTLRVEKGPTVKTADVVVPPGPGRPYDVAL
jgi:hypothetical protein